MTERGEFLKVTTIADSGKTLSVTRDQAPAGLAKQAAPAERNGEKLFRVEPSHLIAVRGYFGTGKDAHAALATVSLVKTGATDPTIESGVKWMMRDKVDTKMFPYQARVTVFRSMQERHHW